MLHQFTKNLPTASDVHIDGPLTNMSLGFMQSENAFVATKVFPMLPVAKQSDKYFTYDRSYWYRNEMKLRAPSTESAGAGFAISTDDYFCDVYALHKDIDDDMRGNADSPIQVDRDASGFLSLQALLNLEKTWTTNFFTTSKWTTDKTPTTTWDDPSSDPVGDVQTGVTTITQSTGVDPSSIDMTIGYLTWEKLVHHPDLVDRIKYGQTSGPAQVTLEAMAAVFGVGRVLVARAVENTADEGATASYSFISGKHALLSSSPASTGLRTPSSGYTIVWTGRVGANQAGAVIRRIRADLLKSDRYEIEQAFVQKLVSADLGYFFNGAVA